MKKIKEIEELKAKAEALTEKQTWVKHGLQKVVEEINKELENIPDTGLFLPYHVVWWDEYDSIEWLFDGKRISPMLRDSGADEDHEWQEIDLEDYPPWVIRNLVEELPGFIEQVIEELDDTIGMYQKAIEILKKYRGD